MSEESLREIIGLAQKRKWNQIKKFLKFIIQKTLKKNAGYSLTALDVSINGKKQPEYNTLIKNKENIKDIDKIIDFKHLSLYQTTQTSNNHIEISQNDGNIVVLAKYLGPSLNNHQIFDFSVHLDALDEPFFTIGSGRKMSSSEILKIINNRAKVHFKNEKEKIKIEPKQVEDTKIQDIEVFVFEKLTNKNAIWNGTETKAFMNWKAKIKNKYRIESGKIAYYKGKPTKLFSQYLNHLYKKKDNEKTKPITKNKTNKANLKKDIKNINENHVFETLTGKNTIWNGKETKKFQDWKKMIYKKYRKETGKSPHYKGTPTKSFSEYLENLINKKTNKREKSTKNLNKKTSNSKKNFKEITEQIVFETLTDKNATWNGSETKNFLNWKRRIHSNFKKKTGKNPHYRGELTQNFKTYLKNLIKTN